MEALAFVEVIDRHREVVSRHPVHVWPVTVGRSYAADIIIDDPFVAPLHVSIEPAGDGRFKLSDLGSVNGMSVGPSRERVESAQVGCDEPVRLGHTQLRVRTPDYAVAPERRLLGLAFYRRTSSFAGIAALMIAVFAFNAWVMTTEDEHRYLMFFPVLGMVIAIAIWTSIWYFVGSAIGRRPNYAAHGSIACAGVIALITFDALFEYLAYGFNAQWLDYAGLLASIALVGYIFYWHLLLNSRARPRNLMLVSVGVSLVLSAATVGADLLGDMLQEGNQEYSEAIKAPAFLFVGGTSPDAFMAQTETLKRKVDELAKTAKSDNSHRLLRTP